MLKVAFLNLFRHKGRTFLSAIGIVIGVAAIIAMVSVVDGLFSEVSNAIGQVNGIRVLAAGSNSPIFSRIDASRESDLESVRGVTVAVPFVVGPVNSIDKKGLFYGNTLILGIDVAKQNQALASGISGEIVEGREIRVGENGVAVIGKAIKSDYDKFLNQSIEINGEKFRVVGVYSSGSPFLESSILVSIFDARKMLGFPDDKVSMFNLELVNPGETNKVVDSINFRFREELRAASASDLSEQFGGIIGSFRVLVIAVAAISAIVAGVGIVNTMLMSVLERFKEIGALKAVGWTNSNIINMVMVESVLISFIGAIGGILLGFIISVLIEQLFGFTTLVSFELLVGVFVFAFGLGIVSGAYPAFVASKMDPVDALRSE